MTSKITTEKYDLVRMEKLKHFLESNQQNGRPKFYEVFVDNLKVVEKTSDPAVFGNYMVYMGDDTRMVKVLIYTSTENCPRNDKFIFTVSDPQQEKKQEELSGLEIENKISSAIEQERSRNHLQQLQKELEEDKLKLEECEQYSEELEEKLNAVEKEFEAFRKKRVTPSEMNAGKLVGFATDYFVKNYPGLSRKVPFISTLSGLLNDEESTEQLTSGPDGSSSEQLESNASFSKKNASEASPQMDAATQSKLNFFTQMEASFSEDQLEKVIQIIQRLANEPEQVDTVHSLLHSNPSH